MTGLPGRALPHRPAAVDDDRLAGGVAAGVAHQPLHRANTVLGAAVDRQRGARPQPLWPAAAVQLQNLIEAAEKSMSPTNLSRFYNDLLSLYGELPWAKPQMDRIREKLEAEK